MAESNNPYYGDTKKNRMDRNAMGRGNVLMPQFTRISIAPQDVAWPSAEQFGAKTFKLKYGKNAWTSLGLTKLDGGHQWTTELEKIEKTKVIITKKKLILKTTQAEYNRGMKMLTGDNISATKNNIRSMVTEKKWKVIVEEYFAHNKRRIRWGLATIKVDEDRMSRGEVNGFNLTITFVNRSSDPNDDYVGEDNTDDGTRPGGNNDYEYEWPDDDNWDGEDPNNPDLPEEPKDPTVDPPGEDDDETLKKYKWRPNTWITTTCYDEADNTGPMIVKPGEIVFAPIALPSRATVKKLGVVFNGQHTGVIPDAHISVYNSNMYGYPNQRLVTAWKGSTGGLTPDRRGSVNGWTWETEFKYTLRSMIYWVVLKNIGAVDIAVQKQKQTIPLLNVFPLGAQESVSTTIATALRVNSDTADIPVDDWNEEQASYVSENPPAAFTKDMFDYTYINSDGLFSPRVTDGYFTAGFFVASPDDMIDVIDVEDPDFELPDLGGWD